MYSLFESERYNPSRSYFSTFSHVKPWTGKLIELPAEVKEALLQSLERTQGFLTNAESSLLSSGAGDLLWACRHDEMKLESGTSSAQERDNNLQVHVILTWHVATGYYEIGANAQGKLNSHLDILTKLSKYCAYFSGFCTKASSWELLWHILCISGNPLSYFSAIS